MYYFAHNFDENILLNNFYGLFLNGLAEKQDFPYLNVN